ncbi:MAG: helix-turn-helix domain-containing protein [Pseudoruegeria sp.]
MNNAADGFIRLMLVQPFVLHVETLGIKTDSAFRAMGLRPEMVRDPGVTVHAEIMYGLCNALSVLAKDPCLGCHVGEQFDITQWPPVANAAQGARTVGEFLCRYLLKVPQEASSVRHRLTVELDRTRYEVQRLFTTRNPPRQIEGFGISMHLRLLRMAVGADWDPSQVMVETPFPEAVPRNYMDIKIARAECPGLILSFPPAWLHASPDLNVAGRVAAVSDPVSDLSMISALRSAAMPYVADISAGSQVLAEALGLEVKSLEAALRLHKTTPAREFKRLRVDLAREALVSTDKTIAEIGRSLGYSDQSHFARFFRSQTDQSPQEYRRIRKP